MVITFQRWITGISILGFIALLAACGGGGGGSSDKPTPTSVATSSTPTVSSSALSSSTISSELSSSSPESSSSSSAMPVLMGGAIQGNPLNIATVVSTFAGGDDIFYRPDGITTDGTNLYVADTWNNTIRKIVIATGEVSTLAGGGRGSEDGIGAAASFFDPSAITTDGTNLYVTDSSNYTIRKIVIATGAVTTLAGTAGVSGSADGTGAAARFSMHYGITTDGTNLYVADSNNYTIRKIVIATGVVTTLAGTAQVRGNADGIGAAAVFFFPEGITTDGTHLYVDDTVNNTIRKIVIATGAVTTFADSAASGITTDGTNLYLAGDTIRKITISTGTVTTLAGTEGVSGSMDGVGSAASFNRPYGITTDGFNLFVTDTYNNTIRKIH